MPDSGDFYAFKSTSGGNSGGSGGCFPWIIGAIFLLCIIGKLSDRSCLITRWHIHEFF